MSLGDLWARTPSIPGLGILSKLRSQLELPTGPIQECWAISSASYQAPCGRIVGRISLTLGHTQVVLCPSSASFLGTESFSNGIVLSSDPMASAVTSVSPGCIYCQKDDCEIPNISNHQHYDRGSNTSQIYYSLSVTNI